jgi:hypothetical protein
VVSAYRRLAGVTPLKVAQAVLATPRGNRLEVLLPLILYCEAEVWHKDIDFQAVKPGGPMVPQHLVAREETDDKLMQEHLSYSTLAHRWVSKLRARDVLEVMLELRVQLSGSSLQTSQFRTCVFADCPMTQGDLTLL